MVKNPTPQQIAIFSALFVLGLASFSLFLFHHLHGLFWIAIAYAVWGAVFFIVTYQVFIYFLRRYIYRKVKLIYKTIHTEKLSSEEKSRKVDMRRNIIEEAEMEVAAWAEQQRTELDKYKSVPVIVVCAMGQHSGEAVKQLQERGFGQACKMAGGMAEWAAQSLPVVK